MEKDKSIYELFGEVIYAYTRKQAIEDGVLVDVSDMAKQAGIRFPVAVTSAVWHDFIVPNKAMEDFCQSEDGRLWDVLWMFRNQAKRLGTDRCLFQVYFFMDINGIPRRTLTTLKAICGPGDNGEPVITLMRPDED